MSSALDLYGVHMPRPVRTLGDDTARSARMAELERENAELRTRLQRAEDQNRAIVRVIENPTMPAAVKLVAIIAALDVHARQANGQADPEHHDVPVNLDHYAERTGQSSDTVGKALTELERAGWRKRYRKELREVPCTKTGEARRVPATILYVAPPAETPAESLMVAARHTVTKQATPGKQGDGRHGGKRTPIICPDCGDVGTVHRHEVHCVKCKAVLDTTETIEPPTTTSEGSWDQTIRRVRQRVQKTAPREPHLAVHDPPPRDDTDLSQAGNVTRERQPQDAVHGEDVSKEPQDAVHADTAPTYTSPLQRFPYTSIGRVVSTPSGPGKLEMVRDGGAVVTVFGKDGGMDWFNLDEIEPNDETTDPRELFGGAA